MTKIKLAKKFTKIFFILVLAGTNCSCQSRAEKLFNKAQEKLEQHQFVEAVELLKKSSDLEKNNRLWSRSTLELARILRFDLHDFIEALRIYRELILKSEDASVRLLSQRALSEIYFENLQDYVAASKELLLLESLVKDNEELDKIRFKIAQCYKYTGNFKTTLEYIDIFLPTSEKEKSAFLKLKAQVYSSLGQFKETIKYYDQILEQDKEYFINENLYVAKAIALENNQDYKASMSFLEANKNNIKDEFYVDLRIKRLKEKLQNKPFNKGVRK